MKITQLLATLIHIPWGNQLDSRAHPKPILEVVVVEVQTDEGLQGFGYTFTDGFGGHSVQSLVAVELDELARGADPEQIEPLVADLFWKLRKVGDAGIVTIAMAGFEIAMWDLKSKAAGKPLIEMLGYFRERMPVYSSAVGSRQLPVDEQIRAASELVANDFIGVKIQVGRIDEEEDVERIRLVREGLGPKPKIIVDANTLWDVNQAIRVGRRIEEHNIFYMEEPIPPGDVAGHVRLSRSLAIPTATGEEVYSARGCFELIRRRAVSYIQPNVCRVGGISEWLKVAKVAAAFDMKVAPHFIPELHVQLTCTIPNALVVEYFPGLVKYLKEPPTVEAGWIYPRRTPGLGMEFPDDVVKKFRVE